MNEAIIEVQSETSCRISGLDADTRRRLSKQFSYEIPGARHMPAVRLGRWDGKVTFFSLAGQTYINLLPEILPVLEEEKYTISIDDQRAYNVNSFNFVEITENSYNHIMWPVGHSLAGQPIVLRDYQVTAINGFFRNPQSLGKLPTGSGKTIITAALSHACEAYGRTIVIVPNKTLVNQTEADYIVLGLDVGVYFGDRKEQNKTHTICTWQSLNNMMKNTKSGEAEVTIDEFIEGVCCVICDECHGVKADALKTILTGPMGHVQLRWGMTGTIPKEEFEFRSLQIAFGEIVNSMQASDLQDAGVLANCHIHIKQLVDHVEFKEYQSELSYLLSNTDRLAQLAKMISDITKTGNTLVLVDRVAAGKALAALTEGTFISGATKEVDRKEQYDDVATSDNKALIATYGVASTGINVPKLHNVVLIEPGKSFVRVIQSIGRGLRLSSNKKEVNIWDITSTCKFAKRHLTKRKSYYTEAKYPFSVEKVNWKGS